MPNKSTLESLFETLWAMLGDGTPYVQEHRFHSVRKWRFDVAFLNEQVAVELEGAVWTRGRHTRGSGYIADCDKYNQAQLNGWLVIRLTSDHLNNDPASAIETIKQALEIRRKS